MSENEMIGLFTKRTACRKVCGEKAITINNCLASLCPRKELQRPEITTVNHNFFKYIEAIAQYSL